MKLSEQDKSDLRRMGAEDVDFPQIERATRQGATEYFVAGTAGEERKAISREEAIELLGRKTYLSGICHSAFHVTASRTAPDGRVVLFDSSPMFGWRKSPFV